MRKNCIRVGKIPFLLGVCLLLCSCGANREDISQVKSEVITETEKQETEQTQQAPIDKSIYMDADRNVEERVEALLSQMTLEEKIGQMVQPEQNAITYAEITKYGIGSVLSGGGSAPASGNTAKDWQNHVNKVKQAALESRLGIPALYGVDAVHGHNNVYGATVYPHNIGLGAADDEELMRRIGEAVAGEVRATGIEWTFAPTLANPQNVLWGRTYEGYGEDSKLVARLGAAFIAGIQGEKGTDTFLDKNHVLATAKHYIGEGYTVNGINQGDVCMPEEEFETLLHEELLLPYKEAIEAGARTVMVSYNSVNGVKCHENQYLITDILKGELGFTGFVISDYNGVQQVSGSSYKEQIANCVNAGVDMLMEPNSWKKCIATLQEAVEEGLVSMERVDDAVSRILRVKFEAGLFEEQIGEEETWLAEFGSDEHRAIAREAVSKSMVLLKNDTINGKTAMETLSECKNILVAGEKADDIGIQCGGWTISWQGSAGDITEGTTILEGLKETAGEGVTIDYSEDGDVGASHDAVILVVGETPYAESSGDRSISNLGLSVQDRKVLSAIRETAAATGKEDIPVIAVMVAGRPLTIAEQIEDFDALVMTWLPGTEGAGVGDVLLGDKEFTATLPYTWTWYASGIEDIFETGQEDKILFRKGSGLRKDGSSITTDGTVKIGQKPEQSEEEIAAQEVTGIDLESSGYILEAENFTSDSYLVRTGNSNNINYVDNWKGQWANSKWQIWVPKAGNYRLHFKIAAAKDSNTVAIYYQTPTIDDDGNANRTTVPMTVTENMDDFQDFTLEVTLEKGTYQFKFMTNTENGADFRLDCIEFEYLE